MIVAIMTFAAATVIMVVVVVPRLDNDHRNRYFKLIGVNGTPGQTCTEYRQRKSQKQKTFQD